MRRGLHSGAGIVRAGGGEWEQKSEQGGTWNDQCWGGARLRGRGEKSEG